MTNEEMLKILQERGAVSNTPDEYSKYVMKPAEPESAPYCKWKHDTVRIKSRGSKPDLECSAFFVAVGTVCYLVTLVCLGGDIVSAGGVAFLWLLSLLPARYFWTSDTVCLRCGKVDLRFTQIQRKAQAKEDAERVRQGQAEAIYKRALKHA